MEILELEVRFDIWCAKCKYKENKEDQDPCNECLNNPVNTQSTKPVNWEDKDK